MIRFSIEVRSGTARFRVAVQAESIERALEIARGYNADKDLETLSVGEGVAGAGEVVKVAA